MLLQTARTWARPLLLGLLVVVFLGGRAPHSDDTSASPTDGWHLVPKLPVVLITSVGIAVPVVLMLASLPCCESPRQGLKRAGTFFAGQWVTKSEARINLAAIKSMEPKA